MYQWKTVAVGNHQKLMADKYLENLFRWTFGRFKGELSLRGDFRRVWRYQCSTQLCIIAGNLSYFASLAGSTLKLVYGPKFYLLMWLGLILLSIWVSLSIRCVFKLLGHWVGEVDRSLGIGMPLNGCAGLPGFHIDSAQRQPVLSQTTVLWIFNGCHQTSSLARHEEPYSRAPLQCTSLYDLSCKTLCKQITWLLWRAVTLFSAVSSHRHAVYFWL